MASHLLSHDTSTHLEYSEVYWQSKVNQHLIDQGLLQEPFASFKQLYQALSNIHAPTLILLPEKEDYKIQDNPRSQVVQFEIKCNGFFQIFGFQMYYYPLEFDKLASRIRDLANTTRHVIRLPAVTMQYEKDELKVHICSSTTTNAVFRIPRTNLDVTIFDQVHERIQKYREKFPFVRVDRVEEEVD
jgi:hypothetical protein